MLEVCRITSVQVGPDCIERVGEQEPRGVKYIKRRFQEKRV